jgi:hypothetical protein
MGRALSASRGRKIGELGKKRSAQDGVALDQFFFS